MLPLQKGGPATAISANPRRLVHRLRGPRKHATRRARPRRAQPCSSSRRRFPSAIPESEVTFFSEWAQCPISRN